MYNFFKYKRGFRPANTFEPLAEFSRILECQETINFIRYEHFAYQLSINGFINKSFW